MISQQAWKGARHRLTVERIIRICFRTLIDFKAQAEEVMEKMPSEVTEVLDEYLSDYLFPEGEDGIEPSPAPAVTTKGA